jgi:hypothetical protein
MLFPNDKAEYPLKQGSFLLNADEPHAAGGPVRRYLLVFKDTGELELASIALLHRGTIDIEWKSAAIMKRPDIVRQAFWLLQSCKMVVPGAAAAGGNVIIHFKQPDEPAIRLPEPSTALLKAGEVPPEAVALPPAVLPPGWQVTTYTEWDAKETALRTAANASQVLKFHKPGTSAAVESWFVLTFRPGFTRVESSFAKRIAADQADLGDAESKVRVATADYNEHKAGGMNEHDLKPFADKKAAAADLADAYKAAVAGYKDLTEFDVPVELPDGLRLTTLHFRAGDK